jgi:hypothetical protein
LLLACASGILPVASCGVDASRRLKPAIPERGFDGIPLRHELEVVRDLGG